MLDIFVIKNQRLSGVPAYRKVFSKNHFLLTPIINVSQFPGNPGYAYVTVQKPARLFLPSSSHFCKDQTISSSLSGAWRLVVEDSFLFPADCPYHTNSITGANLKTAYCGRPIVCYR